MTRGSFRTFSGIDFGVNLVPMVILHLTTKCLENWLKNLKSIKHTNTSKVVKLSLVTKHSYLVMLLAFFNYCVKMGYISRNPAKAIILPALKHPSPKACSLEDILAVLKRFEPGSVYRIINATKYGTIQRLFIMLYFFYWDSLVRTFAFKMAESQSCTIWDVSG